MKFPVSLSAFTRRLLWQLLGAGIVTGLVFGGCDNGEAPMGSAPVAARPASPDEGLWREAARAVLAGRAFERAVWARRSDNDTVLTASITELNQLRSAQLASRLTLPSAERLVERANTMDVAGQSLGDAGRESRRTEAARLYREALRLSPDFPSGDAQLLNGLGYFLAERGTTPRDFADAERFTRAALAIYDAAIARTEANATSRLMAMLRGESGGSGGTTASASLRAGRAIGPRDSLAWALFRQNRTREALREQQGAVAEAETNAPTNSGLADLRYHLGQMLRASGQEKAAREQFQKALQLVPHHEPSQRALQEVK